MPSAVVIGGGLAGITAACELADSGHRVTLYEKRPFLGGRAYSYTDKATGTEVDNGQHVFLGCCTEYIRLLERLGVRDRAYLQERFRVPVVDKVWGTSTLISSPLPPPLHLGPSLAAYRSLTPADKARAGIALAGILRTDRAAHHELDDITFEEWLRRHRQSPHAIASLWNLIIQPTLNDDASRVSADLALMVFQEGFLRSRDGANVGWAKVGLSALIGEAARRYIEDRGGEVRPGVGIAAVEVSDGRASVRTPSAALDPDVVVVAVPPQDAPSLLPDSVMADPFFARIRQIETSPIVNIHLWYDRPVWGKRFAAFLNTPVQWVFNKTRLWGLEDRGQYLDISLSGAHDYIDMPNADILALFTKEMFALFPPTRGAELTRALIVKQRDATFAARPGVSRLRPGQRTPVQNLFLAGDWTATGWPATMESAVRSGLLAAAEARRASMWTDRKLTTA
jgi:squalene-associated FAD-dependent desaturase